MACRRLRRSSANSGSRRASTCKSLLGVVATEGQAQLAAQTPQQSLAQFIEQIGDRSARAIEQPRHRVNIFGQRAARPFAFGNRRTDDAGRAPADKQRGRQHRQGQRVIRKSGGQPKRIRAHGPTVIKLVEDHRAPPDRRAGSQPERRYRRDPTAQFCADVRRTKRRSLPRPCG